MAGLRCEGGGRLSLSHIRRPASDAELLRLALKTWGSPEPASLAPWFVRALGVIKQAAAEATSELAQAQGEAASETAGMEELVPQASMEPQAAPLRAPRLPSSLSKNLGTRKREMPRVPAGASGSFARTR